MKAMQPSMSAGELAPGLHGRVDLARYAVGLKTCRNCITLPTGGVAKRTGYRFRGGAKVVRPRLLPFIFSTTARYVIEVGNEYMRFWYLDANNQLAQLESTPGVPYEIASPYTLADAQNINITQSADVLYMACPGYRQRELRRLTPDTFEIRNFINRLGPFRPLNINKAARAAVSAPTGVVTIACSEPIFEASMVGGLFYIEEHELQSIAPWEPGQRSPQIGVLKRSDGKIYRCTGATTGGSYYISGSIRPVHEEGRAWDGAQDQRSDGVGTYGVGCEWEYVSAGYGIAEITAFTDSKHVTALVTSPFPDSCVGNPTAVNTWTFNGDGVTKTFAITGATATSPQDYAASINNIGVPP